MNSRLGRESVKGRIPMSNRSWKLARSQRGGTALGTATVLAILAAVLVALALGGTSNDTADAGGEKPWDCGDLKLKQATYVDPFSAGKSSFSVGGGSHAVTLSNVSDRSFDWSSTLGMDAALVKTWFTTNAYTYDEATSDKGLAAYKKMKIQSVVLCFDPDKEPAATPAEDTAECHDRKGCPSITEEPVTEKCTNRKGCAEVTPEFVTPENGKCTNRKGCPTATPITVEQGGGKRR